MWKTGPAWGFDIWQILKLGQFPGFKDDAASCPGKWLSTPTKWLSFSHSTVYSILLSAHLILVMTCANFLMLVSLQNRSLIFSPINGNIWWEHVTYMNLFTVEIAAVWIIYSDDIWPKAALETPDHHNINVCNHLYANKWYPACHATDTYHINKFNHLLEQEKMPNNFNHLLEQEKMPSNFNHLLEQEKMPNNFNHLLEQEKMPMCVLF